MSSSKRRPSDVKSPISPTSPTVAPRARPQYSRNPSSIHRSSVTRSTQPRRESSASVTASIGTALDAAPAEAEENDYAHNAISTLLSPPIVRTGLIPHTSLPQSSTHRPPTARDIAPVTLSPIPLVESSAFNEYLSQVGPLFESFNRAKAAGAETSDTLTSRIRANENHDEFSEVFGRHAGGQPMSSPSTSRRPSVIDTPSTPTTPRSQRSRRALQGPTPLSTIPQVYFDEDFHLENPRTFDVVSEFSDIIPPERPGSKDGQKAANGTATAPSYPRKALHTNAILQEKLSWYMDTVEVHLISSIAAASTSFFAALGSLKELQAEAAESIEKIKSVRSALQTMDKEMALGGLELAEMRRKGENLRKLGRAINQLCEVVEEAKRCEELVDEGNVEAATTRIDLLEDLIQGRSPTNANTKEPPSERIDLRRLKALDGISDGIEQLRNRIGKGFEERFKDALLNDMREHVKSVSRNETLQRFAQATFRGRSDHRRHQSVAPTYLNTSDQLRQTLLATLAGLSRAGQTSHAATAYREAIMREMKSMIRQHLPSSNDDDAESITSISTRGGRKLSQQEKSAILARNLRALDAEAMEELLTNIYTTVGEALRRLGIQTKILLDVTVTIDSTADSESSSSNNPSIQIQSPGQTSAPSNVREQVTEALDLSSLLGQAVDIIQGQITKVLKVRRDENTHLPLEQFLRFFMLNRLFADECEAVSSRSGDALKEVVNAQVKDFVTILADTEKARISTALDADRWDVKDFDEHSASLLTQILDAMTTTPKAWTSYTRLWQGDHSALPNGTTDTPQSNGTRPSTARAAHIDENRFFLTSSSTSLLPGMTTFLHLIAAIPAITPDASSALLTYLKHFNSRTCQLILGAGATKSAGLKNINSKHLALASQACSFVVALLPYIREFVRRQVGTGPAAQNVLGEFDKVKRLFWDHQASIHDKLADIMAARSAAHVKAFREIDWDKEGKEEACKPVEDLCKETGTLHRVLNRHVSEADLGLIMGPIFRAYGEEWGKAVAEVGVKTEAGRQRLLHNMKVLQDKIGKLEGAERVTQGLVDSVEAKKVDAPEKPQTNGDTANEKKSSEEQAGSAMFDADEEAADEAAKSNANDEQHKTSSERKSADDKGGGGKGKGHQRNDTVEILGRGGR